MRLLGLSVAALLLVSCATGALESAYGGPPFAFDLSSLPANYAATVEKAGKAWNTRTGKTLFLFAPSAHNRVRLGDAPGNHAAWTQETDRSWTMTIDPTAMSATCQAAFEHEFGHVLDSEWNNPADPIHSPNPNDLMYYGANCYAEITPADLASIAY